MSTISTERYRTDPVYRAKTLAKNREWHEQHGKARARKRREDDPGWMRLQCSLSAHKLTLDQFHSMFENQDFGCKLCGEQLWNESDLVWDGEGIAGRTARKLHIDHDHVTGKVRGLLCPCCNTGLGKFKESPEILMAAIKYVTR